MGDFDAGGGGDVLAASGVVAVVGGGGGEVSGADVDFCGIVGVVVDVAVV